MGAGGVTGAGAAGATSGSVEVEPKPLARRGRGITEIAVGR